MSTVPALFRRLVDDAATFPPGDLPLTQAVTAHRAHRRAPYAALVGPFVCLDQDLTKVADAAARTDPDAGPLEVSVVVSGGAGGIESVAGYGRRSAELTVFAVDIRLRAEEDLSRNALRVARMCDEYLDAELAFVELGLEGGWERALDVVAESGHGAKLRTGGLDAALFPTTDQVAGFISACLDREVPFKCTAGLHNAVRHTDPATGFEHHGFLNVLLATRASLDGAAWDEVAAVLADTDGEKLAAAARDLSDAQVEWTRRWFTSFGSCSIAEPRQDLTTLGLLEAS